VSASSPCRLDANEGDTVFSDEFFDAAGDFLRDVNASLASHQVAVQSVMGLMYLNGEYVRWTELQAMLQFANGDCGERERQQIQKKLAEASELVGKQVSDTMSSMTTMIDSKRPSDPSGGAAAEDPANPAGLTVQPPLREEAAAAVSKSDLDRLALGAGLFFGQLVKEGAIIAETVHAHPHETIAPTVTALSETMSEGASTASDAIIVGAKASGAVCLNIVEMINHFARNESTMVQVSLFRPYGEETARWLVDFNNELDELASRHPLINASITGFGVNYLSLQMYTLSHFPYVVAFTGLIISLILFISYRSLVVALRSAITNLFCITIVYGTVTLIYSEVGVAWMVPIITFSILIGLNMDYDVFLVTGILSARSSGLSNRAAIVAGLENNGTVIGVAGLIMAAAFSGLLFSHTVANQQLGLVILIGITFDTVFLQTMLVPSLMAQLGELNWWPSRFPDAGIDSLDDAGAPEESDSARMFAGPRSDDAEAGERPTLRARISRRLNAPGESMGSRPIVGSM